MTVLNAPAPSRVKDLRQLGRAVRFVWDAGPGWMIASLVLLIGQGALPLAALYLMKLIVDAVSAAAVATDRDVAFEGVLLLIGFAAGVALLSAALDAAASLVGEGQAHVVTDRASDIIHAKAVEIDLEFYENPEYYNALHRAQQEAPSRPTRVVRSLTALGQNGISLLGIAGLLIAFNWQIAAILFGATLPGALVRLRFSRIIYRWQRRRTLTERQAQYCSFVLTVPWIAKEVRLFGLGSVFRKRHQDLRRILRLERLSLAKRKSLTDLGTHLIAIIPVFGAYAFVAYQTVQGALTLGGLVMYYGAFQRGQAHFQSLLKSFTSLYEDNLFLSSLYEFLGLKPKVADPREPRPFPTPLRKGIQFTGVSFQYPSSTRKALQDVNLTIRPGEVVVLVGENGSGKTTLVKLLARLYDPTEGVVSADDTDIRRFAISSFRRQISVVFQDFVSYGLTARENIWIGDVERPVGDPAIVEAARLSGADDVISRLPQGYDTVLGNWVGDGAELSVGQWQKIALARAFLRGGQIIILDEPTSALDARAEHEVFDRFRHLVGGKMAILISHRLSSVRMADRIYVLDQGRIIESGTHDQLMAKSGKYAQLFDMQARYYTDDVVVLENQIA